MKKTDTAVEQPELMPKTRTLPSGAVLQETGPTEAVATVPRNATGKPDALSLIVQAMSDPGCDPAKLRELLAVRREWNADEAAAAFNAAVVEFQQKAAIIPKLDTANGRAYARIDRIWRTVRPLMEACGLAVTWESLKVQGESCVLEGHLRHSRGHAQPLHHEIPLPSAIPGQNAAQRAGSGETYAKRYATCAALGIQTGEDDDGNGGSSGAVLSDAQAATIAAMVRQLAPSVCDRMLLVYGVAKIEELPAAKFPEIESALKMKGAK